MVSKPELIATTTATSQFTGKVYGQFYTSDLASFEFGIIDYDKMQRTTIAPSKHKFVAMGVSSEERVYAVATDGVLYELNTITGEETEVGSTGVYVAPSSEKSYTQSGGIDQDDDTFYWAAYDAERNGALYSVDLKTGKATLIAEFPHNEQILGMAIPEATPDAAAPATPTGFSVKFENGLTKGWVSLSAPSKTYGDLRVRTRIGRRRDSHDAQCACRPATLHVRRRERSAASARTVFALRCGHTLLGPRVPHDCKYCEHRCRFIEYARCQQGLFC